MARKDLMAPTRRPAQALTGREGGGGGGGKRKRERERERETERGSEWVEGGGSLFRSKVINRGNCQPIIQFQACAACHNSICVRLFGKGRIPEKW